MGSMMASDIRVSGASVQREVPRILFQSFFVSGEHARGQSHAFAVTADGQRFLVPQYENLALGFARGGGVNAAIAFVLGAVSADRRASIGSTSQSAAPITVVLDWTNALKR